MANAQDADKIEDGRRLASLVCSTCHLVGQGNDDVPALHPPAPSFVSIVRRRTFSEENVKKLLLSRDEKIGPHAGMPNLSLMDYQVNEIAAYLQSLRARTVNPKTPAAMDHLR